MSDLSPKDIDQLFQQGSNAHHFEYNEFAWKELEQQLDKKDRRRALIYWLLGVLGMLLVVGIGYHLLPLKKSMPLEKQVILNDLTKPKNNVSSSAPIIDCLLYTSPSPRDQRGSRMPSSA